MKAKRPLCLLALAFCGILLLIKGWQEKNNFSAINASLKQLQNQKVLVCGILTEKGISQGQLLYYLDHVIISTENDSEYNQVLNSKNDLSIPFQQDFFKQNNQIICQIENDLCTAKIGNMVEITGSYQPFLHAENEGQFDAYAYYGFMGYCGRLTKATVACKDERHSSDFSEWLFGEKLKARLFLYRHMEREDASVISAMLLGDKKDLDKQVKQIYQKNGIAHILAISGLHISLLGMLLYRLLCRMGAGQQLSGILSLGMVFTYVKMTGESASAIRAAVMFACLIMARLLKRTYDALSALALAFIIILIRNPYDLSSAGFVLSFAAVLGIALVKPLFPRKANQTKAEKLLAKYFIEPLFMSLCILLFTLPLLLWYYYSISPYATVLNICILPVVSVLLATAFLALFFRISILLFLDTFFLSVIETICQCFQKLPYANLIIGRPKLVQMVLYYLLLGIVIGLLYRKRNQPEKSVEKKAVTDVKPISISDRKKSNARLVVLLLGCFGLGMLLLSYPMRRENAVDMLSVGQGDCIVLRTRQGHCVIIDAGSSSEKKIGTYKLIPYLKYHGISTVDAIFISHPHEDHISGICELLEQKEQEGISVRNVLVSEYANQIKEYDDLLTLAKENSKLLYVHRYDTFRVGDLQISCVFEGQTDSTMDMNDTSLVLLAKLGGCHILFTGDSTQSCDGMVLQNLRHITKERITVLKVAHHGSQGATSEQLLKTLRPQVGLISCGLNNQYLHPHKETICRLEKYATNYFITKNEGQIRVGIVAGKKGKALKYYVAHYPFREW